MFTAIDAPVSTTGNRLLAALPANELQALQPKLEPVRLRRGRPLYEPGQMLSDVYFPTAGVISIQYVDHSATTGELAQIGCEGLVGLPTLLGGDPGTLCAVVQFPGQAYRLKAAEAKARFAQGGQFHPLVLKFAHLFLLQVSQTAMCNLHHSVEQQLCRWLLACVDRLQRPEIEMTHEQIAATLAVRRQGVTEAARKLERRGIIAYWRGRITVLERKALEQAACTCYGILTEQSEALFSAATRRPVRVAVLSSRHS